MEVFRTTQAGLVGYLKSAGRVQSLQVEQTMTAVDRRHFVERSLPLCLVYQVDALDRVQGGGATNLVQIGGGVGRTRGSDVSSIGSICTAVHRMSDRLDID